MSLISKEVEFKYNAKDISLTEFMKFCEKREPVHHIYAAGYDHFYENAKDPDAFCRHRLGPDMNQLTFKRKIDDANNYIRTEHNVDLMRTMTQEQISALLLEFGYKFNVSIFKTCFVYVYDYYVLVYYIVYDLDMKELNRFVEIEMKEDYPWEDRNHAWDELVTTERLCKSLGINVKLRVKPSLFEMYKKDLD